MAQTRLLIIDDDPDYVDGIRSILEKADYQVDVAYNPNDGFSALETGNYDLLLLDIMMGRGAEGVMVARKINKDPELRARFVLYYDLPQTGVSFWLKYQVGFPKRFWVFLSTDYSF